MPRLAQAHEACARLLACPTHALLALLAALTRFTRGYLHSTLTCDNSSSRRRRRRRVREEEEQQEHEEWRSSRRAHAGTYDEVLLNVIVGRSTLTLSSHPPAPVQSTTHTQSDYSDIRTHKRHTKTHTHTSTRHAHTLGHTRQRLRECDLESVTDRDLESVT